MSAEAKGSVHPKRLTARGYDSICVAVGGVLGTLSRYGVDILMIPEAGKLGFPWPTFLINITGAALLGFIMAWVEESESPPAWLRPGAAIGFCGAYTTFSTASVEILLLGREGHSMLGLTYLIASVAGGLLAVTITTALAVKIFRKSQAMGGNLS